MSWWQWVCNLFFDSPEPMNRSRFISDEEFDYLVKKRSARLNITEAQVRKDFEKPYKIEIPQNVKILGKTKDCLTDRELTEGYAEHRQGHVDNCDQCSVLLMLRKK